MELATSNLKSASKDASGRLTMSKADYAKHRKVSPGRISQLIKAERVVVLPDGRVDVEASDKLLEATTDFARKPDPGQFDTSETVANQPRGRPAHRDKGGRSYQDARRDRELWKARSDELAFRREVGELVEWSKVQTALAAAIGPIMGKLEALPKRLAQHVNANDVRAVMIAAEREVQQFRQELAGTLRQLATETSGETRQ